jgi:hypothetical protein
VAVVPGTGGSAVAVVPGTGRSAVAVPLLGHAKCPWNWEISSGCSTPRTRQVSLELGDQQWLFHS